MCAGTGVRAPISHTSHELVSSSPSLPSPGALWHGAGTGTGTRPSQRQGPLRPYPTGSAARGSAGAPTLGEVGGGGTREAHQAEDVYGSHC